MATREIGLLLLCCGAAWGDIHDEFRDCQYDRLKQLKAVNYRAATAVDQFCMGYAYWRAIGGFAHDPTQSAQWFARAAAQGHPGAETVLGYHYEQGHGVPKDYRLAVHWIQRAAAQGYADAMFHMGRLASTGKGVQQSQPGAHQWFEKSAAAGSADAIVALRQEREHELEQPARAAFESAYQAFSRGDFATAAAQYSVAAQAGNASAMVALGTLMRTGRGLPKDEAGAVKWYRAAAAKGLASAGSQLGFAYEYGEGVEADWKTAAKWCTAAGRQFDRLGLYCLARMYQFGIGVPQDRARAIKLFDRAEDQGDGQSKFFAQWLRVPDKCIGYRDEPERERYAFVCKEPKGIAFGSLRERYVWLGQRMGEIQAQGDALRRSMSDYGQGMCGAAGGSWSNGCFGEGGQRFDPGQQDRYGRPLW